MPDTFDLDAVLSKAKVSPAGVFDLDAVIASAPKKGILESFIDRGVSTAKGLGGLASDAAAAMIGGPLEQATFLPRLASGMREGLIQSGADTISREALQGQPHGATGAALSMVPGVGPYVMDKVNEVDQGDWRKVAGETGFDALAALATSPGARAGAGAIVKAVPGITREALAMAKDAASVRTRILNPTIGEAAATGLGAAVGGPAGAKIAYTAMKVPEVVRAVLKGRAARMAVPGEAAPVAADLSGLSPNVVSTLPEVVAKTQELLSKGADPQAIAQALKGHGYPEGLIKTVLDEAQKAPSTLKPIPPSKLTPEPAPEVKPVTMRETAAAKEAAYRAKASGDVVEAKPAFPGQQGAKGATAARFRDIAERTVAGWIKAGKDDAFIMNQLRDAFKMSPEDAVATLRAAGGKS